MATVTVFSNISRAAGDIGSAAAPGPYVTGAQSYNGAATSVVAQIVSSTWATDDPAIVVTFALDRSLDGGATWTEVEVGQTNPQQFNAKGGGLPSFQVPSNLLGTAAQVRVRLGLSATLKMGMSATIT